MAGGKAADPQIPGGNHPMRPDQALNATHKTRSLPPGAQSGLIRAQIIIVSGGTASGVFIYNGKPGPGNPPIISATNGTKDPFGNTVIPGVATYFGSPVITARLFSGAVFFAEQGTTNIEGSIGIGGVSPSSQAVVIQSGNVVPGTAQGILSVFDAGSGVVAGVPLIDHNGTVRVVAASGSGQLLVVTNTAGSASKPMVQWNGLNAADAILGIDVSGDTFNRFKIDTGGKHTWGPGNATQDTNLYRGGSSILQTDDALALSNGTVSAGLAGAVLLSGASGTAQVTNASSLIRNIAGAVPATTPGLTVNGITFANLATAPIPAADAGIAGAVYRLHAAGNGTWGTGVQLTLQIALGSTGIGSIQIAGAAFSSAASIRWNAVATLVIASTGAGGTAVGHLNGSMNLTGTALNPGTAGSNTLPFDCGQTGTASFDTTSAQTLNIQAEWAATTGTPSITSQFYYL